MTWFTSQRQKAHMAVCAEQIIEWTMTDGTLKSPEYARVKFLAEQIQHTLGVTPADRWRLFVVPMAMLVFLTAIPAHAQIPFFPMFGPMPVSDDSTIAKNVLTKIQAQIQTRTERDSSDTLRRMGRSLDLFAPLIRYKMQGVPLLRTRWPDGMIPVAQTFADALNAGDPSQAAYRALVTPVGATDVDSPDWRTTVALDRRRAFVDALDMVGETSLDLTGRVRGGRKPYREVLNKIEDMVSQPAGTTGVANQQALSAAFAAQQAQVRLSLRSQIVQHLTVEAMLEREGRNGSLAFKVGAATARPRPLDSPMTWSLP